jgi:hypothetical protein
MYLVGVVERKLCEVDQLCAEVSRVSEVSRCYGMEFSGGKRKRQKKTMGGKVSVGARTNLV